MVEKEQYQAWLTALDERLQGAALTVASMNFYGFDPDEFAEVDLGELSREAVELAFAEALDDKEPDPYSINHRLIERALPLLAAGESPAPLDRLAALALEWGAHARNLSLYLRALVATEHETEMIAAVSETLTTQRRRLSPWVQGWLTDALAHSVAEIRGPGVEWLRHALMAEDSPWFLRGRAAVALALRGEIVDQSELDELFSRAPGSARADFVAAVALAAPDWSAAFIGSLAADPILSCVPDIVARPADPGDAVDDDFPPF